MYYTKDVRLNLSYKTKVKHLNQPNHFNFSDTSFSNTKLRKSIARYEMLDCIIFTNKMLLLRYCVITFCSVRLLIGRPTWVS